jgi:hypothetical protein
MTWALSRFRTGDLVQVRSRHEILATLDRDGCVDGMPFMPEMLQYCGHVYRVRAVAHKTCETAHQTWKGRRLDATVHLTGLRCDGAAHGGCQAACSLFWKDVWLKPAGDYGSNGSNGSNGSRSHVPACTETQLVALTRLPPKAPGDAPRYSCQATKLYEATQPLAWWDPRQYLLDVVTRNHSVGHVLRVLWLATLKYLYRRTPRGYRLIKTLHARMHRWLTGRDVPDFEGAIDRNQPTPSGRLDLRAGERVRIKSKEEIVQTIDVTGRNRGLGFDVEMSRYCGDVATVRSSVTTIIDELTGEMRHMKQPCLMLDGVVCNSEYSECRLLCPRAIPSYWREIWVSRID